MFHIEIINNAHSNSREFVCNNNQYCPFLRNHISFVTFHKRTTKYATTDVRRKGMSKMHVNFNPHRQTQMQLSLNNIVTDT